MNIFKKIFLFCMLLIGSAQAATISIELHDVQRPDQGVDAIAYTGEQFVVKIVASGANRNSGSIEVDGLDEMSVAGQNRATSFAMVNGELSSEITQELVIHADREGVYSIGPARIKHDGKTLTSNSFKIRVTKRPEGTAPKKNAGKSSQSSSDAGADFFCKLVAPKKTIVMGEPLEVNLLMYRHGPVLEYGLSKPIMFTGFRVKEVVQSDIREETIKGKKYLVQEKKLILFPDKPGQKTIEPVHFAYNIQVQQQHRGDGFDSFFQAFMGPSVEQRRTTSNSFEVNVKPSPSSKQGVDAVGKFTRFQIMVDKQDAVANEPILVTLEIEGKADFERLVSPKLRLPQGMKFYESKSEVHEDFSQNYTGGKKRFEFVVQIAKPGAWEIPAQELRYFDTGSETFKTMHTEPVKLNITQAEESVHDEQQHPDKPEESSEEKTEDAPKKDFVQDIHFIEEDAQCGKYGACTAIPWWGLILLLLMPVIFVRFSKLRGITHNVMIKVKFGSSKERQAFSEAQKQLTTLEKTGDAKPLYQLMIKYLATKFETSHEEVTEGWLEQRLRDEGWSPEKINEFVVYLNECAGLYFSSLGMSEVGQRELLKRGNYWLLILNK